jgi:hypothetical protein
MLTILSCEQVHDPESPGGRVGPGATLGDLLGLAEGRRFDMVSGEPFDADKAYKDSKLCNILFTRELSDRLQQRGSSVIVNSFGPGTFATTLTLLSSTWHLCSEEHQMCASLRPALMTLPLPAAVQLMFCSQEDKSMLNPGLVYNDLPYRLKDHRSGGSFAHDLRHKKRMSVQAVC